MAYMNQEKKAKIAARLKKVMPKGWKYSLAVRNHSSIVLTIKSAPVDLLEGYRKNLGDRMNGVNYMQVNHYHLYHGFEGKLLKKMEEIVMVLNTDNYDNSDIQTDYFDVGHYVDVNIGRWNKPFEVK